jgi:hypothetical protein
MSQLYSTSYHYLAPHEVERSNRVGDGLFRVPERGNPPVTWGVGIRTENFGGKTLNCGQKDGVVRAIDQNLNESLLSSHPECGSAHRIVYHVFCLCSHK